MKVTLLVTLLALFAIISNTAQAEVCRTLSECAHRCQVAAAKGGHRGGLLSGCITNCTVNPPTLCEDIIPLWSEHLRRCLRIG